MATDTTHTYPERRFPLFGLPRLVPGLALTGALAAGEEPERRDRPDVG